MSTNDDQPIQGELVPADGEQDPFAEPARRRTGGGFDLGSMMEMAANMQQQVAEAQEQLAVGPRRRHRRRRPGRRSR